MSGVRSNIFFGEGDFIGGSVWEMYVRGHCPGGCHYLDPHAVLQVCTVAVVI